MIATPFAERPVDRILKNGRFITADARFSIAEAVAIAGDRIVAVGPSAQIERLAQPNTRVDDLGGATVLPGLIDAHTHMLNTGTLLRNLQLYDCRSIAAILDRVSMPGCRWRVPWIPPSRTTTRSAASGRRLPGKPLRAPRSTRRSRSRATKAIRLYTTGAAHAIGEERTRGCTEPGRLADFVVLDRDILTCPINDIRAITPRRTIVSGADVLMRH